MVNELKKENQWLTEVNSQALLNSIRNLDTAYKNFFRDTHAVGFPRFKSRKNRQSFQCPQHCSVDFGKGTVSIPKAKDIPAVLHRRFKGTVKTVTVSMTPLGKYFASVLVDTAIQELPVSPIQGDTALGIDLGIKSLAVCSDGRTFDNPKNLQHSLDHAYLAAEAVEPQTERFCQPQQGTHPRGAAAGTYRELPQGQPSQDHPCTHARQPSAYTLHGESEREGDAEQPSLSASRRRRFLRDVPDDA